MLRKLLKYDLKSTSRMMWTIILGVIILSILASASFTVNIRFSGGTVAGSPVFTQILRTVSVLFTALSVLVICAASMAVIIMLAYRFYKNFFDNEGYLTFTLPVSTNQKLVSKIISSGVWLLVSFLAMAIALGIFLLFGTATQGLVNREMLSALRELFMVLKSCADANSICILMELILMILVSILFNMLLVFLAITIGSILSAKHKIIASVGMYFAISLVVSIVETVFFIGTTLFFERHLDLFSSAATFTEGSAFVHTLIISQTVLMALFCVVAYVIMHRILERKLNLP